MNGIVIKYTTLFICPPTFALFKASLSLSLSHSNPGQPFTSLNLRTLAPLCDSPFFLIGLVALAGSVIGQFEMDMPAGDNKPIDPVPSTSALLNGTHTSAGSLWNRIQQLPFRSFHLSKQLSDQFWECKEREREREKIGSGRPTGWLAR